MLPYNSMLSTLLEYPEHIERATKIDVPLPDKAENIVYAGMGGSGIAGIILQHMAKIPFFVNRDYSIPEFVSSSTLFIAVSYSGNTEETISAYKKARERNSKTVIITSGGELGKEKNAVIIPSGMQPRAAFPYLFFPLAISLAEYGYIKKFDIDAVLEAVKSMKMARDIAIDIANNLEGNVIIYGSGLLSAAATRWRQQLNENAKLHAFDFPVPECNHNEIESWEREDGNFTVIFLRSRKENERIRKRFEFMKKIYGEKAKVMEIFGNGEDEFSELIYLIYFGDLVSVYKAIYDEVEPEPVNLIARLKEELKR